MALFFFPRHGARSQSHCRGRGGRVSTAHGRRDFSSCVLVFKPSRGSLPWDFLSFFNFSPVASTQLSVFWQRSQPLWVVLDPHLSSTATSSLQLPWFVFVAAAWFPFSFPLNQAQKSNLQNKHHHKHTHTHMYNCSKFACIRSHIPIISPSLSRTFNLYIRICTSTFR